MTIAITQAASSGGGASSVLTPDVEQLANDIARLVLSDPAPAAQVMRDLMSTLPDSASRDLASAVTTSLADASLQDLAQTGAGRQVLDALASQPHDQLGRIHGVLHAVAQGPSNWLSTMAQQTVHPGLLHAAASTGLAKAGDAANSEQVKTAFKQEFAAKAANKQGFDAFMRQVFGDQYDMGKAEQFRQQALAGDFSFLPDVRFVDAATLQGNNGAYNAAEGVVYINRDMAAADPAKAAQTFVEEAGHHLDATLNRVDTKGDEGEMFRRVLAGEQLSAQEISAIRNENDHGTVTVDGKKVEVEFWSFDPIGWAGDVVDGAAKVGGALVDGAQHVGGALVDGAKQVGGALVDGANTVGGAIADGAKAAGNTIIDLGSMLVGGAKDAGSAIVSGVSKAGQLAVRGAKALFGAAKDGVGTIINGAAAVIKVAGKGAAVVGQGIADGAKWAGNAIADGAKWVGKGLAMVGGGVIDGVKVVGRGALGAFKDFGKGLFIDTIGGFATNLYHGNIGEAFHSVVRGIDRAVFQSTERFYSGVLSGAQSVANGVTRALGPIGKPLRWVTDRAFDIGQTLLDTTWGIGRDAFRIIPDTVTGFVGDVERAVKFAADGRWDRAAGQFAMAFVNTPGRLAGPMVDMGARFGRGAASVGLTAIGNEPPARQPNADELRYLKQIYGDSVDYDMVRIKPGGLLNGTARTVGNTVYMPDEDFKPDGTLTADGFRTLGHEVGHVWQNQNGGGDYIHNALGSQAIAQVASGDRNAAYDWRAAFNNGKGESFETMNDEQRAKLMEDIGVAVAGRPFNTADKPLASMTKADQDRVARDSMTAAEQDRVIRDVRRELAQGAPFETLGSAEIAQVDAGIRSALAGRDRSFGAMNNAERADVMDQIRGTLSGIASFSTKSPEEQAMVLDGISRVLADGRIDKNDGIRPGDVAAYSDEEVAFLNETWQKIKLGEGAG